MFQHSQPVYSMADAFKALKVSKPTGYKLISAGTLETYTLGRRRFATAAQLDECIARLTKEGAA